MTLPQLIATCAAAAAASAALIGPPVAKLLEVVENKNPNVNQIRRYYEWGQKLSEPEP